MEIYWNELSWFTRLYNIFAFHRFSGKRNWMPMGAFGELGETVWSRLGTSMTALRNHRVVEFRGISNKYCTFEMDQLAKTGFGLPKTAEDVFPSSPNAPNAFRLEVFKFIFLMEK